MDRDLKAAVDVVNIYRHKHSAYSVAIVGIALVMFGLVVLYLYHLSGYPVSERAGRLAFPFVLAMLTFYIAVRISKQPILSISKGGIAIYSSIRGRGVLVSWEQVGEVDIEFNEPILFKVVQSLVLRFWVWFDQDGSKCLLIKVRDKRGLPFFIRGAFTYGRRLYFYSLSMPIESVRDSLVDMCSEKSDDKKEKILRRMGMRRRIKTVTIWRQKGGSGWKIE